MQKFNLPDDPTWSNEERLQQWQHTVGRISFSTYNTTDIPIDKDKLLADKIDIIRKYANGQCDRMFVLDMPDENGWLTALETAYNALNKAGKPDVAKLIEEVLNHHIELIREELYEIVN